MTPLVSCIMPTRNRPEFVPLAVSYFVKQDYPNRELIILDDSSISRAKGLDWFTIHYADRRIRFLKIDPPNSIGHKRNLCCDYAKGELICHWDDDDWQARDRISRQAKVIEQNPEAQATAYKSMIFARDSDHKAWRFTGDTRNPVGVSLMYKRAWWKQHRFDEQLPFGEDNRFVTMLGDDQIAIADLDSIVARIHTGNTCQKSDQGNLKNRDHWTPVHWDCVTALGYEEALVCA